MSLFDAKILENMMLHKTFVNEIEILAEINYL